jgi:hypothetical protein
MGAPDRILFLRCSLSINGAGSFKCEHLAQTFRNLGSELPFRCWFVDDRDATIERKPLAVDDATDVREFEAFNPNIVIAECAPVLPDDTLRLPAFTAVSYVESGGAYLVLEMGYHNLVNLQLPFQELAFFGAQPVNRFNASLDAPFCEIWDMDPNDGLRSDLRCRPSEMNLDPFLSRSFDGVDEIVARGAIALNASGEIAAASPPTSILMYQDVPVRRRWKLSLRDSRQGR